MPSALLRLRVIRSACYRCQVRLGGRPCGAPASRTAADPARPGKMLAACLAHAD